MTEPLDGAQDISPMANMCASLPEQAAEFLYALDTVDRLRTIRNRQATELMALAGAVRQAQEDGLQDRPSLGPLEVYTPSGPMRRSMQGVADVVEQGFDGEVDAAGWQALRALVAPPAMLAAFCWGMLRTPDTFISGMLEEVQGDPRSIFRRLERQRAQFQSANSHYIAASQVAERLRQRVLASGCIGEEALRDLAAEILGYPTAGGSSRPAPTMSAR